MKKKKIDKAQRLSGYDPTEVSFVKRPANYKKFLIHKSAGEPVDNQSMKDAIKNLPKETLAAIDAAAAKQRIDKDAGDDAPVDLSEGAQAALKAIGRILAPYRDELRDAHMDAVQEAVGIGDSQVHPAATPEGLDDDFDPAAGDQDDGTDTEGDDAADNGGDGDQADASDDAPAAAKPAKPAKEGKSKAGDSTPGKSGDIVNSAMGKTANLPSDAVQKAMDAATKAFSTALKTAINKSADSTESADATAESKDSDDMGNTNDNAADKDQVSKSAHEAMAKELAELKASHKELVEKSVARDKELSEQKEAALTREYAERAAQYESVGDKDKIAAILKSAHGNKEAQENLEAILKSARERASVTDAYGGNLLSEVGTRQGSNVAAESEMQALVNQRIEKSADKTMTKEQHFVDVIKNTAEGRKLYARLTEGV